MNLLCFKSLIVCLTILFMGSDSFAQKMLKKLHQSNQKINAAFGFRAGEPMGLNIQFYKGDVNQTIKSRNVIDINIAKEGTVFNLGPRYKMGEWRPGGTRYSVSWFREVNHQYLKQYLYFGLGLQGGSRNYQRLAKHYTTNFNWGPQLTLHGELPLKTFSITPNYLYIKLTVFAECIYHKEIGEEFSYVRPAGGLRVNFFY